MAYNDYYFSRKYQTGGLFDLIIQALDKSIDPTLKLALQRQMMMEQFYDGEFRRQIVAEVTDDVLSRLNIELDIAPALQQIKDLQQALDNLGK